MLTMHLTQLDAKSLMEEPSPEARGLLASKIAKDYCDGNFNTVEADLATDIFRILSRDVEIHVRHALAEELAHSPDVPHDIIRRLAGDEPEVAAPVLEFSSVLTEDDLVAIVKSTREAAKLCAVARRETVSGTLAGLLLESRQESVAKELFRNNGATLEERLLSRSWDFIASAPGLLETLVHRGGLPLAVAEKIYAVVSDDL
ncbi:MAG: DUF2336 domain-containing protein, partial [Pseudomonadota bacterium]|nr:DUF2336 domain-containing protein [Pseudomonadota bacterium]